MKDETEKTLIQAVANWLTLEELVKSKRAPKSVADFFKYRRELYNFILKTVESKIGLINAEPKVGKKDMVIFSSLWTRSLKGQSVVHFYVTALMRNEIKEQAEHLEEAGVIVLTKKKANEKEKDIVELAIQKVVHELSEGRRVIIHFDESDYGTDFKSKWAPFMSKFLNNECCWWRLYSATNEEAELSKLVEDYGAELFKYTPPEAYRGAKWLLEQGLVYTSSPFFHLDQDGDIEVTQHGDNILKEFLDEKQKKPILIIRHSLGDQYRLLMKSDFKSNMIKEKVDVIYVDKDNDFKWDAGTVDIVNRYRASQQKTIIILNQKATRSTEIYCQKYLYGFHDHRKLSTNYNTYAQSSLRVAHYDEKGHRIKLWTSTEVIKKAAGLIGNEEFLNTSGRNISSRVGKNTKIVKNVEYNIYDTKQEVPQELFNYRGTVNTFWSVSKHNQRNLAQDILEGIDLSNEGTVRVIYVDGKNTNNEENNSSFEELKSTHPELIGKWITHKRIEKEKKSSAYIKEGKKTGSIFNKLEKIAS